MANLLEDIEIYFLSLTSSHEICTNLNATFSSNGNLFLVMEPSSPTDCVTIIPYGGAPLDTRHKEAQYPSIQIRVRTTTVNKGYKVTQAIINDLHQNVSLGSNISMQCFAIQSQPVLLKFDEEDYPVYVANFNIMHTKYSVS